MGCRKCAERRRAEAAAKVRAEQENSRVAKAVALKAYEEASAWHRWGWRFIHRFSLALPTGALDSQAVQHMRRVVQLFIEVLPCEDCRGHATNFLASGPAPRLGRVQTGQALTVLFHELHNNVRMRQNKPQPGIEILQEYRNVNLRNAFEEYKKAVEREPPIPRAALNAMDTHLKALGL